MRRTNGAPFAAAIRRLMRGGRVCMGAAAKTGFAGFAAAKRRAGPKWPAAAAPRTKDEPAEETVLSAE